MEIDKDRSGWVGIEEFENAMVKLGAPLSSQEARDLFELIDTQSCSDERAVKAHDGKIVYAELLNALKKAARSGGVPIGWLLLM